MSDLYIVSAANGSGQKFVANAIVQLLTAPDTPIDYTTFAVTGNYFDAYQQSSTNWEEWKELNIRTQLYSLTSTDVTGKTPLVIIEPVHLNTTGHSLVNYITVASLYPKFKHVIVTIAEEDVLSIATKHFHQIRYKLGKPLDSKYWEAYLTESVTNAGLRKDLTDWHELTAAEIDILINLPGMEVKKFNEIVHTLNTLPATPDAYASNVITLKYSDIIGNKEAFLSTLALITGKEVTPAAIASYDSYIALQATIPE